ncbi:MAG: HAD-IA family hydrolase [Patescibacteria group bacterium]
MRKTVIFDFDGTIANTWEMVGELLEIIAPEFGYEVLSESELLNLRDLGLKSVLKKLKIPWWQVPRMALRINQEIGKRLAKLRPIDDISEVLTQLATNYSLGIVSSNRRDNIVRFLELYNLEFFDFVYSEKSLFGKDKMLLSVIKKHKLTKDQVIYVGDEVRDLEAANKVGVKMVAVEWGLNSSVAFAKQKKQPASQVSSPAMLPMAVSQIFA